MLRMEPDQTIKYEVFITKKCAGNLRDLKKESLPHDHRLSIIQQMLKMLKHLKSLGKCHNDIKPGNLLFDKIPTLKGAETDSTGGSTQDSMYVFSWPISACVISLAGHLVGHQPISPTRENLACPIFIRLVWSFCSFCVKTTNCFIRYATISLKPLIRVRRNGVFLTSEACVKSSLSDT